MFRVYVGGVRAVDEDSCTIGSRICTNIGIDVGFMSPDALEAEIRRKTYLEREQP
jgi:hypothetical protein